MTTAQTRKTPKDDTAPAAAISSYLETLSAQHEKFAAIHRESHDKVTELLNPEQAAKWEEMRRQHQAQMPKPQ